MNVYTVRIPIIVVFIIFICFIVFTYANSYSKKKKILLVIISILVFGNIIFAPYEMFFLKFSSVEDAFQYSYPIYKLQEVVPYRDYSIVIYESMLNDLRIMKFKNTKKKWNFKSPFSYNYQWQSYKNYKLLIENIQKEHSYMILLKYPCSDKKIIVDSLDSNFTASSTKNICYQYAILEDPPSNYYIKIGNMKWEVDFLTYR